LTGDTLLESPANRPVVVNQKVRREHLLD
jgi:hypothetical protein